MGFLKRLFIVEEEGDQKPEQQSPSTQQQQPQQQVLTGQQYASQNQSYGQPPINVPPVTYPGGNVDPSILKMISDVIEQYNVEGNDYYELNKIVESPDFKNAIPDERSRIVAAFHSLKAQDPKFDKQKVLDSIDFYIKAVKGEYNNVLEGYNQFVESKINAPKQTISELQNQRQELVNKISQLDVEIQTIEAEVAKCSAELEAKRANYEATFNIVLQNLDKEKNQLNAILP